MKMIYGGVPVNSMKVKHYEMDTNSATVQPSDMQAGVTCFARGKKIIGTGKCFSFASYGESYTNLPMFIPDSINTIQIGSNQYPVKMIVPFQDMKTHNFNLAQKMAEITIDNIVYPITVSVQNGMFDIACDETIKIQLFCAKDEYV